MNNGELNRRWHKLRRFRPVYFIILFLVSAVICVFALRANNLQMVTLRDQVYAADKSGHGVEDSLQKLQNYVTNHMNTSLSSASGVRPPIQLKYTYDRLVAAQNKKVSDNNKRVYRDAQTYCQKKIPDGFSGRYRISCVEDYVKSHGVSTQPIPADLYKFDFVSPAWSPDLAGWSLVAAIIFLVLTVIFGLTDFWFKRRLKRHQ